MQNDVTPTFLSAAMFRKQSAIVRPALFKPSVASQTKAAEDSRTPKPRGLNGVRKNAPASWSAAVLCRFEVVRQMQRSNIR
jgi:hypothetical protein